MDLLKKNVYFIQGCFFQTRQWLETRMGVEGIIPVVEEGLVWDMFGGVIRPNPNNPTSLIGGMIDHYSESELSKITVSEDEISFTKKYIDRDDFIDYQFKLKNGEIWIGGYQGLATGKGIAQCMVTQIPEWILDPRHAMELLKVSVAHER